MLLHGLSDQSRFRRAVAQQAPQRPSLRDRMPANTVEASGRAAYERMKAAFGG